MNEFELRLVARVIIYQSVIARNKMCYYRLGMADSLYIVSSDIEKTKVILRMGESICPQSEQ